MKALIQRVSEASVSVDGREKARIGKGYAILLGVTRTDADEDVSYLARKTAGLRVFPDAQGRMNLSIQQVDGEVLVVSQFTLCADTRKGNRPGFANAAEPETADRLYRSYVNLLRECMGPGKVHTGTFQAHMTVHIVNDGPVTINLDSQ
jgi:D-tyrosyl-tRNA(Tyr) deacylase